MVGISDVDTRRLTRMIRERGAMAGCIAAGVDADADQALAKAQAFPGLKGMDLAKVVSRSQPTAWNGGGWSLGDGYGKTSTDADSPHVVAYDFGVKNNILRMLAERGCRVTVVPAQTPAKESLALGANGIFLSNGPGDPEPCRYAVSAAQRFLNAQVPMFGICLGHQILALAAGGKTMKMPFGHHGANHPVQDLETGDVIHHQPEPRLRGGRRLSAGNGSHHPSLAVRRHRAGPPLHRRARLRLPRPPRSQPRPPTTAAIYSTRSWP